LEGYRSTIELYPHYQRLPDTFRQCHHDGVVVNTGSHALTSASGGHSRQCMDPAEGWAASRRYDSVVSIGSQCLTSALLKTAGLKRYSGPFDWIFSNLRMVADCIEDDFATFLNREYLVQIPVAERHGPDIQFAHHEVYRRNYRLDAIFNHRDPTDPAVYAYLQRCVDRFGSVLRSGRPHLLLAISTRRQGGSYGFNRLCDVLEAMPTIELCVLIARDPGERRALTIWEERGRHRLIDLDLTSTTTSGFDFAEPADNRFVVDALNAMIALPAI
jgi:hypothetical protein